MIPCEIIAALKNCQSKTGDHCLECKYSSLEKEYCMDNLLKDASALIEQLRREIKRLQREKKDEKMTFDAMFSTLKIKAIGYRCEAIEEFAAELKEFAKLTADNKEFVYVEDINKLMKEHIR